jgi:hypothetical protein
MAKNRNRRGVGRWKRLLATVEANEEKCPGLVPYKLAIQEFLEKVKAAKKGSRQVQ